MEVLRVVGDALRMRYGLGGSVLTVAMMAELSTSFPAQMGVALLE